MYTSYADVLESYMIAEEAESDPKTWKDAGKSIAVSVGAFAAILAALGIKNKISEIKEDNKRKKSQKKLDAKYAAGQKDAFNKLDQRYNLSSMSKNEYDKFVKSMYAKIILDINKSLKPLNSNEILNKYKNKYIKKYPDDIKDAEKMFKPGLFKIWDNQIPDYVNIIGGNQEVAMCCHDICENVADALVLKYSEFCNAGIFSIGTGDGDEGCIYPWFVSYETMRKKIS